MTQTTVYANQLHYWPHKTIQGIITSVAIDCGINTLNYQIISTEEIYDGDFDQTRAVIEFESEEDMIKFRSAWSE
jgi:hypothetical protein